MIQYPMKKQEHKGIEKRISSLLFVLTACILFVGIGCRAAGNPPPGGGDGPGNGDGSGGLPTYEGHTLNWNDEFNGDAIDTAVWRYDEDGADGGSGWGNREVQFYSGASGNNAYIEDGSLVIEARAESRGGHAYTSARLHTHGSRSVGYGILEARIRQPNKNGQPGRGIFPAFWLLGDSFNGWGHTQYGGNTPWPPAGEIDVMEVLATVPSPGNFHETHGSLHWQVENLDRDCRLPYQSFARPVRHCSTTGDTTPSPDIYQNYHTYGIQWTPTSIRWYVDRTTVNEVDITSSQLDEFRQPFFVLFNVAVGALGGTPFPSDYPQKMYIDWVRYYRCDTEDCPTIETPGNDFDPFLRATRSTGNFAGVTWDSTSAFDATAYTTMDFYYRLAAGAPDFFVQLDEVPNTTACAIAPAEFNNSNATAAAFAPYTLKKDNIWQRVRIPLAAFTTANAGIKCNANTMFAPSTTGVNVGSLRNIFSFFLNGSGTVDIDEIMLTGGAGVTPLVLFSSSVSENIPTGFAIGFANDGEFTLRVLDRGGRIGATTAVDTAYEDRENE